MWRIQSVNINQSENLMKAQDFAKMNHRHGVKTLEVLLRRLWAVEQRMDSLWPYGMGCVDFEQWFALFRRRANLSVAIWNRRAA